MKTRSILRETLGERASDINELCRLRLGIIPVLFAAFLGPPAMSPSDLAPDPIIIRMFLFREVPADNRPAGSDAEIFPASSRPETAEFKTRIRSPENALAAVAVDGLFDLFHPAAVQELFFHEADWSRRKPTDDPIIGSSIQYQVRLFPRTAQPDRIGLKVVILRSGIQALTGSPSGAQVILQREVDLDLDDPLIVVEPGSEGRYGLFIWASRDVPEMRTKTSATRNAAVFNVPPPAIRSQILPVFPEALRRNQGGRIGLKITIDRQGNALRVDVVKPLHPYLNYSAVQAVRQWTFEPVQIKGEPVSAAFPLNYDFNPWLYLQPAPWAVQLPPGLAPESQEDLPRIMAQAAEYCRKLADIVSAYHCEESITETHYDLLHSRRWGALAVVRRPPSLPSAEEGAFSELKDRITQGQIVDDSGDVGRLLYFKIFQYFDPRRDRRTSYLSDYQVFRKDKSVREHRKILKENGKKPAGPETLLHDRRFSALGSIFAPLRILAKDRQSRFIFWIEGEEKIRGRKALILAVTPKAEEQDGILAAKMWLDKSKLQVLKCEIEGAPLDGQEDLLNECAVLNTGLRFLAAHEYDLEKNGVLHPWRSEILAAYSGLDPRGLSPRLKISLAYDKYKFFSVATETEIIR